MQCVSWWEASLRGVHSCSCSDEPRRGACCIQRGRGGWCCGAPGLLRPARVLQGRGRAELPQPEDCGAEAWQGGDDGLYRRSGPALLAVPWLRGPQGHLWRAALGRGRSCFAVLFVASGICELAWRESPEKEPGNFGDPLGFNMFTA